MKNRQKGFALIESILLLVIVILIAGTGYYVWHSQKQADKILAQSEKASQSSVTKIVSATNYMVIKEWSVKLGTGNDKNVTYVLVGTSRAFLVSKSDVNNPDCLNKDTDWPTPYVLLRGKPNDVLDTDENGNIVTFAQDAIKYPSEYTKLGGYYYRFMGANGNYSCHTNAEEILASNVLGKSWTPNVQPL